MAEPVKKKDPKMVVQLTDDELKSIVTEAVQVALRADQRDDKLLSVEQVCEILNVREEWLYHNVKKLPFVRKIGVTPTRIFPMPN